MHRIRNLAIVTAIAIVIMFVVVLRDNHDLLIFTIITLPILSILAFVILLEGMKKVGLFSLALLAITIIILIKNNLDFFGLGMFK